MTKQDKSKFVLPVSEINAIRKLSSDFELNEKVKELYIKYPDLVGAEDKYAICARLVKEEDTVKDNIGASLWAIWDEYISDRSLTYSNFVRYVLLYFSELEQGPVKLKNKLAREILIILLHISLSPQKEVKLSPELIEWLEGVKKEFVTRFPKDEDLKALQKALHFRFTYGLAPAMAYLKSLNHYPKTNGLDVVCKDGRVWIATHYTVSQRVFRGKIGGAWWRKYLTLIKENDLKYQSFKIRTQGKCLLISLPASILTIKAVRRYLPKVWKEIEDKQVSIFGSYNRKIRQIRNYNKTYRLFYLNKTHSIAEVTKIVFGDYTSATITRYILGKRKYSSI